jgi:RNA polymerase sigma-70 factor (ECF subfamily)
VAVSFPETNDLIRQAKEGDQSALEGLVARFRRYLYRVAWDQLASDIHHRVDPSDVVQESCLEFHRDFHSFRGTEEAELQAWLKRLVQRNVSNTIRHHVHVAKRSIRNEQSLAGTSDTGRTLEHQLPADQSSPSKRARRAVSLQLLEDALDELPSDQGEAIRLRYIRGWSLAQLALHFDRSEMAVAGLLKRGLQALRNRM